LAQEDLRLAGFRRGWLTIVMLALMLGRSALMADGPPVDPSPPTAAAPATNGPSAATAAPAAPTVEPDAVTAFEQANQRYEEGHFAEAAAAYEALLARGAVSPNLHFNLGNARFKVGQFGQAIVHYRLAARLAPRDPDIQANLRLTREMVTGQPPPAPGLGQRLIRALTLNEWAGLAALSFWVCLGLLTWREWQPFRGTELRRWIVASGIGVVLFSVGLTGAWRERWGRTEVVVTVPEAVVRYGPLEVSPELQVVHDGLELVVLDEKDGWLQVTGLKRGTGWIRSADVSRLPR
jgi:hypothetical protein